MKKAILFTIVVILIAIAGYFGYQKFQKEEPKEIAAIDFTIAGSWKIDQIDEELNNTAFNFIEYTFESPEKVDGKLTGKLNTVSNDFNNPTRSGSYEVVSDGKLIISFPNEMNYEFKYVHLPDEQKLDMDFAGQQRTLTRKNPIVQESIPQTEAEIKVEEEKKQTQLWMDKIADVDWKDKQGGGIIRFNKPTEVGDIITGEYEGIYAGTKTYCKYERLADGELNVTRIKQVYNGVETPLNGNIIFKMQLDEEGNTLTLNNGHTTYTYTRTN